MENDIRRKVSFFEILLQARWDRQKHLLKGLSQQRGQRVLSAARVLIQIIKAKSANPQAPIYFSHRKAMRAEA